MSLFVVDEGKCNRDGLCVAVCCQSVIEMKDRDSAPSLTDDAGKMCIKCGHCVAICPQQALSRDFMKPEECPPLEENWRLNPDELYRYMRGRRSVRNFKDQAVEREVLEKLIECVRYAPSAHNGQAARWLVIQDSDKVRQLAEMTIDWTRHELTDDQEKARLIKTYGLDRSIPLWEAGIDRPCRHAPHLIFAYAPTDNLSAQTDCLIALAHLELAAPAFGLGACSAGHLNWAANEWGPIREAMGLPEGNTCFGAVMIGYPKYSFHLIPKRNEAQIIWS